MWTRVKKSEHFADIIRTCPPVPPSSSASGTVSVISRRSASDGDVDVGEATAEAAAAAAAMLYTKPDECPARDEAAAANAGRTCQRKCETDTDCLNDRKLCLCDGVHCGMSCIRPEKECQELPDPPHGQVHLTGRQARGPIVDDNVHAVFFPPRGR